MQAFLETLKWKIVKWCLGLLSLYVTKRLRTHKKTRPIDIAIIDLSMSQLIARPVVRTFSPAERKLYQECLHKATFWHGTGRMQYENSIPTDIFTSIIKSGHLRPALDIFDPRMGEMTSLSLAWQRMYARIYADMHVYNGVRPKERYGMPRFWAYYFIMASILTVAKEMKVRHPYTYAKELSKWRSSVQKKWSVKVHKNPEAGAGKFFNNGSDIAGNYPILIGINGDIVLGWLLTGQGIELHERRTDRPVPVTSFTHLEVPANQIVAIRNELKQQNYNIPVFSLECCEQYASQLYFSQLVTGDRAREG